MFTLRPVASCGGRIDVWKGSGFLFCFVFLKLIVLIVQHECEECHRLFKEMFENQNLRKQPNVFPFLPGSSSFTPDLICAHEFTHMIHSTRCNLQETHARTHTYTHTYAPVNEEKSIFITQQTQANMKTNAAQMDVDALRGN